MLAIVGLQINQSKHRIVVTSVLCLTSKSETEPLEIVPVMHKELHVSIAAIGLSGL